MSRTARIVVAGLPHHVVHRGHRRQTVFPADDDYARYLSHLGRLKVELGCRVYAYCLMSNHVHLVVDPTSGRESLGVLMQRLAGWHTQQVNAVRQWQGTLWQGRFKSSPIDSDRYLVTCCRYVELNPVRAGIVSVPQDYPWSSSRARLASSGGVSWLDDPPVKVWPAGWRSLSEGDVELVRSAVRRGSPTGDDAFAGRLEALTGRKVRRREPGRPSERPCERNK